MNKKLVTLFTIMGLMATTMLAFAEPGIKTDWFFTQLSLVILIVAGGLTVMFFVQKQTVKAITTIIVGSLFYIIVRNPESTFNSIGNFMKSLFGL